MHKIYSQRISSIQYRIITCSPHTLHSVQFNSVAQWCLTLCHSMDFRLLCPSLSPGVCSNICPLSWQCHPTISSSVIPFSSHPQSFPALGSFSKESVLCIRWPKYWSFSFSISLSNEYSGLISFRMDWLDLLAVQGTQESFLGLQFKRINSLIISLLYGPTLNP